MVLVSFKTKFARPLMSSVALNADKLFCPLPTPTKKLEPALLTFHVPPPETLRFVTGTTPFVGGVPTMTTVLLITPLVLDTLKVAPVAILMVLVTTVWPMFGVSVCTNSVGAVDVKLEEVAVTVLLMLSVLVVFDRGAVPNCIMPSVRDPPEATLMLLVGAVQNQAKVDRLRIGGVVVVNVAAQQHVIAV